MTMSYSLDITPYIVHSMRHVTTGTTRLPTDPGTGHRTRERLRLARERRAMTETAMAERVGCSRMTLYRLERGGAVGQRLVLFRVERLRWRMTSIASPPTMSWATGCATHAGPGRARAPHEMSRTSSEMTTEYIVTLTLPTSARNDRSACSAPGRAQAGRSRSSTVESWRESAEAWPIGPALPVVSGETWIRLACPVPCRTWHPTAGGSDAPRASRGAGGASRGAYRPSPPGAGLPAGRGRPLPPGRFAPVDQRGRTIPRRGDRWHAADDRVAVTGTRGPGTRTDRNGR